METSPTRVLLVEDEIGDALAVRRSLRAAPGVGESFALEHVGTLAQGIAHLRRTPVDVLLLDLRLPDSDGTTAVARIRQRDPNVPMVVFTGAEDPEVAARAFEAGADEYLVKDAWNAALLRRTLRHAIERRRSSSGDACQPVELDPRPLRLLLHDLKNLQTSILGNARLLHRDAGERGFLRERADSLLGAARAAVELVEKLVTGGDDAREPRRPLELSALVRRAEPLLRAALPEQVDLHFDLAVDPVLVLACPEALRRVLLELVINAGEAISEAGCVEVRTGCSPPSPSELAELLAAGGIAHGPCGWLEVRDDGPGFDGATCSRLFEPGFSTKGVGRGSGLGQVSETLARHDAGLLVRSRPGAGSCFRILLPAPS